jgi:cell division protein FtsB
MDMQGKPINNEEEIKEQYEQAPVGEESALADADQLKPEVTQVPEALESEVPEEVSPYIKPEADKTVEEAAPEFAEPEKKPSIFKRFFGWWFNTDTKFGKFNQKALRWLTLVIGLLAIGFLSAYLGLYRPAARNLDQMQLDQAALQSELTASQALTADLEDSLVDLQEDYDENVAALAASDARNQLLKVLHYVTEARMALVDKDGPLAKSALEKAQDELLTAKADLMVLNAEEVERIESRLDIAVNELGRDPAAAASDLQILSNWLLEAEKHFQVD